MSKNKHVLVCGPGRTKSQFAGDCDINRIMSRYLKTGSLPPLSRRAGQYFDASTVPDYKHALELVVSAQATFNTLPSAVRDRFANDPQRLLEFCSDPSNYAEAVKLGLAEAKPAPPAPQAPGGAPANP